VCVSRERQDSDGQMKELQDQLEAEQYFSVRSLNSLPCRVNLILKGLMRLSVSVRVSECV